MCDLRPLGVIAEVCVAHVSRVLFRRLAETNFPVGLLAKCASRLNAGSRLRDAIASTRDACATQSLFAQQIGSILARAFFRLFFSPLCDLGVISRKQNIGNFPTAKFSRARVLRRFE